MRILPAERIPRSLRSGTGFPCRPPRRALRSALIFEAHRGAEGDAVAGSGRLDDLGVAQLPLEIVDPRLGEALLLARGMVLGVLREVAVGAGLGDRPRDGGPFDTLEAVALVFETRVSLARHGRALDGHACLFRPAPFS